MKLPKHSKTAAIIILVVAVLAGGGAYLYTAKKDDNAKKSASSSSAKDSGPDSNGKQKKTAPDIKPGTKGPTITSPDPIAPSGTTNGPAPPAPKAAD